MNVTMVGAGRVGLVAAACLADSGDQGNRPDRLSLEFATDSGLFGQTTNPDKAGMARALHVDELINRHRWSRRSGGRSISPLGTR